MNAKEDNAIDWKGEKVRTAILSIVSNSILVLIKMAVGIWISSVSVFSEAIHSGIDLLASVVATYAVFRAGKPADETHRFGHGKFENVSGAIEAVLIFFAVGFIVYESIKKIIISPRVEFVEAGLAVMAISIAVNLTVSGKLMKVARKTDSPALEADAIHLKTDVWTSVGVLSALGVIYLSDLVFEQGPVNESFHYVDPLFAMCVAFFILRAAWKITKRSMGDLLDHRLSEDEDGVIKEILNRFYDKYLEFHALRHRRSGPERHIDLHLVVARDSTVAKVHELCDMIEREIGASLPNAKVIIHVEPCEGKCDKCRIEEGCVEIEEKLNLLGPK
jgi:cation diffusion facilitator family transporter